MKKKKKKSGSAKNSNWQTPAPMHIIIKLKSVFFACLFFVLFSVFHIISFYVEHCFTTLLVPVSRKMLDKFLYVHIHENEKKLYEWKLSIVLYASLKTITLDE